MDFRDWIGLAIGVGSIASTVACVYVARSLSRRDEMEEAIAHIQGYLSGKGYRPPAK